ncbi:hypothetical protein [Grimontia marina]|uniref:Uncharacterized protein n=1 Tax=Grimontia marina TaxID=646534 RepID=A0A128FJT4_9GAMM|nr:hypothetical protein [Grimontia marina]CZF87052.1 hypothetical protein GMA8713_05095 [Grimontia marina]
MFKFFLAFLLAGITSYPSYAGTVKVEQAELLERQGCNNTGLELCFVNSVYHTNSKLHMLNFNANIDELNPDVSMPDEFLRELAIQLLVKFNPDAASFYEIEPTLRHIIDDSAYSADKIAIGISGSYKGKPLVGYAKHGSDEVKSSFISSKVEYDSITPLELLLAPCKKIESLENTGEISKLSPEQYKKVCGFERESERP